MFQYTQIRKWAAIVVTLSVIAMTTSVNAQPPSDSHAHGDSAGELTDAGLSVELMQLKSKVADLEAALAKQHQARYGDGAATSSSMASMKKMKSMGMGMNNGMGGMKAESGGMGMMGGGMTGGMGMMSGMKKKGMGGMMGMGMMGRNSAMGSSSMSGVNMPSALPGFPGASHLYHIGETSFFLDHAEHITLTDGQQKQLNQMKESALLATATAERNIEEAEQELWKLTAEAEPDINKIEAKAKQIAQLQVDNRIDFIRAVGKAAEILTREQRQTLVGELKPN